VKDATGLTDAGVRTPARMAAPVADAARGARAAFRAHWPEYLSEAGGLGVFMVSACAFAVLLEHPGSPARQAITDPLLRRVPMGVAMGLTAVAIIYSRWGARSGAHLNPAVTATFWRLRKLEPWDAVFYVAAQLVGGIAGVGVAAGVLGRLLADPSVSYAATVPGRWGVGPAFVAEVLITFVQMTVVLAVSNSRWARWTGCCAGALVATYIVLEAPVSGMSMNPARTLGSAAFAQVWTALWVYFVASAVGMLLAAQGYLVVQGARAVKCAKLNHDTRERCIFRCRYGEETR